MQKNPDRESKEGPRLVRSSAAEVGGTSQGYTLLKVAFLIYRPYQGNQVTGGLGGTGSLLSSSSNCPGAALACKLSLSR